MPPATLQLTRRASLNLAESSIDGREVREPHAPQLVEHARQRRLVLRRGGGGEGERVRLLATAFIKAYPPASSL